MLTAFDVAPGRSILEPTETALVHERAGGALALERLRGLGIALHMDGFGTGFSWHGVLRKLPFDAVKINRSFISTITSSEADAQLVAGIVSMAHSVDKVIIAEGVETEAQLERLRGWGCDRAQGWLFGHPEPSGLLAPTLAAQRSRMRAPRNKRHPTCRRSS